MRILGAAVLVTFGAAAGGAQTRVSAPARDSFVVRGVISPAQMNVLVKELMEVEARQRSLEEQLQRLRQTDGNQQRIAEVERLLAVTAAEFFPRQSVLTLACQPVLANAGRSEGYLGLTFDEEIMVAESRPGAGDVQVRLSGTPRIVAVEVGSPAARAGVRVGDEWVALGARKLDGATVNDLDALLKPGVRQSLRVRRDGREREIEVVVGRREALPVEACERATQTITLSPMLERGRLAYTVPPGGVVASVSPSRATSPAPATTRFTFVAPTPIVYGASFRALDKDVREFVEYTGEGLLVDHVAAGSPAEVAGLRAYDVIVRVNGVVITSPQGLVRLIQEERRAELSVQRKGVVRTVVLAR